MSLTLPGKSRRIRVEPVRLPRPARKSEPAPVPAPGEPAPAGPVPAKPPKREPVRT